MLTIAWTAMPEVHSKAHPTLLWSLHRPDHRYLGGIDCLSYFDMGRWPDVWSSRSIFHSYLLVVDDVKENRHSEKGAALASLQEACGLLNPAEAVLTCPRKDRGTSVSSILAANDKQATDNNCVIQAYLRTTDEMDKGYFVSGPGIFRVRSLVRPRCWRSSVPTASFTAAARRAGQGWPRLCAATVRLGLDRTEHDGMLDRIGIARPRSRRDWK
ncbi:hypothetical protein GW17_00062023 [Ensete ventricosum]|nr:hypothetical protein GW17_00062023 [Ensete ventricosum]